MATQKKATAKKTQPTPMDELRAVMVAPEDQKPSETTETAAIKPFMAGTDAPQGAIAPSEEYAPKQSVALLAQGDDFTGDVDASDIVFPWVQLMHATSELVQLGKHRGGDILLDEEKIFNVTHKDDHKPVRFMVLRANKDYVEKLPYGGEEMPAVCANLAEVTEFGGTANYNEWERSSKTIPYFTPRLTLVAMVEVANETPYSVQVQGVNFTPAMMRVSGAAYGRLGKRLVMNFRLHKRTDAFVYNLSSITNTYDRNTWQELSARVSPESPEFVEELRQAGQSFREMFTQG